MANKQIRSYCKAVQKGNKNQHIVPSSNGWAVKKGLSNKASQIFSTKREAVERGREIAKNQKAELIIHRKDGRFEKRLNP